MTTLKTQVTVSEQGRRQAAVTTHIEEAAPFEPHWDKPVPDHRLDGLTVEEALARLNSALLDSAYGCH